jgi:hypothetical protein
MTPHPIDTMPADLAEEALRDAGPPEQGKRARLKAGQGRRQLILVHASFETIARSADVILRANAVGRQQPDHFPDVPRGAPSVYRDDEIKELFSRVRAARSGERHAIPEVEAMRRHESRATTSS